MSEPSDQPGWTPDDLSAATGESIAQLAALAQDGLLVRQAEGLYEADSLNRVRLIRFARERGVDEDQLVAAVSSQGDLLGIFEGLHRGEPTGLTLQEAASEVGLSPTLISELTEVVGWNPSARATTDDVEALTRLNEAVTGGFDTDPLLQLIRVYTDLLDRLADA